MISSAILTLKSLITLGPHGDADPDVSAVPSFPCPICDQTMTVDDVKPVEQFGLKDVRLHALKCEACGMVADRVYHPVIGYDRAFAV